MSEFISNRKPISDDPMLEIIKSIYEHQMFIPHNQRQEMIDLWKNRRKIIIREDIEDASDEQDEDESLNHVLTFVSWYEDDPGSLETWDIVDWAYDGGAFFLIDGKNPRYIDAESIVLYIKRFTEWYSSMRSPLWAKYLKKIGYDVEHLLMERS
ncbi:hypothetical protein [Pelosinus sp. sgz500959]|uniref:hypothetical protein n=1 Tax=Pelosinus sp. sgz500959 TaxID=3242472 RepID=UPI003671DF3A